MGPRQDFLRNPALPRPDGKRLHARPVIAELPVLVIGKPIDIQPAFGNIQSNGIVHRLFLTLSCHAGPSLKTRPKYPFRSVEKTGATLLIDGPE
ncbi:hypothetical protein [Roseovarius sp. ZX-A-9]|uniref:hypothetical protein n=1 Tax=Roseovarius sp. ZX-A-9 TaxID=3014783 RepID=UPI00232ACB45|nr:hypothetical protein [Roseovarius sp. ZX-A-9]